jgi:SAM-dependent methyltransferase
MTAAHSPPAAVVWHELECGSYRRDLSLWRTLADRFGSPVLEIGAGTGRVALDLAAAGHRVTALDRDPSLLAELSRRLGALPVTAVQADARHFQLAERFALCLVPMQTVQLLGGVSGRRAFLSCASHHLRDGGALAVAIVETLEHFRTADGGRALAAEACARGGVLYSSRPTAVVPDDAGFVLERRRETIDASGERTVLDDAVHIDRLTCAELENEAREAGLTLVERTSVPATNEHTGSTVVILRA